MHLISIKILENLYSISFTVGFSQRIKKHQKYGLQPKSEGLKSLLMRVIYRWLKPTVIDCNFILIGFCEVFHSNLYATNKLYNPIISRTSKKDL